MKKLIFLICPLFLICLFFSPKTVAASYEHSNIYFKEKMFLEGKLLEKKKSSLDTKYIFTKLERMSVSEKKQIRIEEPVSFIFARYEEEKTPKNEKVISRFLNFEPEFKEKVVFKKQIKRGKSKDIDGKYAFGKIERMKFEEIEEENSFFDLMADVKEVKKEESSNLEFTLSILPVRFVYFDNENNVVKIWNNVQKGDSVYVLKFFNVEDNVELHLEPSLFSKYLEIINEVDIFAQGYIYDLENMNFSEGQNVGLEVILYEASGEKREVHTYI